MGTRCRHRTDPGLTVDALRAAGLFHRNRDIPGGTVLTEGKDTRPTARQSAPQRACLVCRRNDVIKTADELAFNQSFHFKTEKEALKDMAITLQLVEPTKLLDKGELRTVVRKPVETKNNQNHVCCQLKVSFMSSN